LGANPNYPKIVVLDNKNVLILGAYANKRKEGEKKKYTTYLYNFEKNKLYKIGVKNLNRLGRNSSQKAQNAMPVLRLSY